jgi:mRNA interferase RelE/StbE
MYRVSISKAVSKQIELLPSVTALKLVRKLMDLASNPRPSGCVKLIGEEKLWRIRQGDFRAVYEIDDESREVKVTKVSNRRETYRKR